MMVIRLLLPLAMSFQLAFSASAATLQPIDGDVRVNHGTGFTRVTEAADVGPGDQVMAGPGGKANLVYPDGTVVAIQDGAVYSVGENLPIPIVDPHGPAAGGISMTTVLVVAAVAGAAIVAVASSGGSSSPASP